MDKEILATIARRQANESDYLSETILREIDKAALENKICISQLIENSSVKSVLDIAIKLLNNGFRVTYTSTQPDFDYKTQIDRAMGCYIYLKAKLLEHSQLTGTDEEIIHWKSMTEREISAKFAQPQKYLDCGGIYAKLLDAFHTSHCNISQDFIFNGFMPTMEYLLKQLEAIYSKDEFFGATGRLEISW